jgi:hypothetical protein
MSDLKFGDRVVVANLMMRRFSDDGHTKAWEPWPAYIKPKAPREGIFLGYRTLQNGIVHYGYGGDDPTTWEQTSTVRVALVCFSERENPLYAPLDAIGAAAS